MAVVSHVYAHLPLIPMLLLHITLVACTDIGGPIVAGRTCKGLQAYCKHTRFGAMIRALCPMSCNSCPTYAPAATCSDAPSSGKILNGKNLTCSQAAYLCRDKTRGPLIRGNCPRTCNSCPAETMPPSTFPTSTPAASSQPNTTAPAVGDQPD